MAESAFPYPAEIDLVRADNRLSIRWTDGETTTCSGETLRWACPCAECKGEAGLPGRLASLTELPPKDTRLDQVGLIGQYALMITFASGHGTGIYSFKLLRSL